jgi:parallel beta-helix repeat protein
MFYFESDYNSVYENNITANGAGIAFEMFCSYNNAYRNNITANDVGIGLHEACNYQNFYENKISNNRVGIDFAGGGMRGACIYGNTITANEVGVRLTAAYSSIFGNNITANSGTGIYIGSPHNNVFGNVIVANGMDGIWIFFGNNSVFGNTIAANNGNGIWLLYCSSNRIIGNNITSNSINGVSLEHCSNSKFYHNNFINNTNQVYSYLSTANTWDDGYPYGGNYWSNYTDIDIKSGPYQNETGSDGIGDAPHIIDEDNRDRYPLMKPYPWAMHDIGITNVKPSKTVVGQGFPLRISVTLFNYGNNTETFNVIVYANTTVIGTQRNINLNSRNYAILTFIWNTAGFAKGNCTISAQVTSVQNETDIADNTLTDGTIAVAMPGDLNADGVVDGKDIAITAKYFGKPSITFPIADINGDDKIDGRDIAILAKNFGKPDP